MTGSIRWLPVRRALKAAAVTAGAWLVWQLIAPGAPPAVAMSGVLAWGLGLIPVHVTLGTPRQQAAGRPVRRPAQMYAQRPERRTAGWDRRVRGPHEAEPD